MHCTCIIYLFYTDSNFWEVFYEFSDEEKKQLLAFVTGSDRVPVGGLSNLKLVIVKNGPDSDRYIYVMKHLHLEIEYTCKRIVCR